MTSACVCMHCGGPHDVSAAVAEESPFCTSCLPQRIAARTYAIWIEEYLVRRKGIVLGLCREAAVEMRAAFPELTEVRGHVHCAWGKRGHIWLVTADGTVVDPTVSQFPGPVMYEPWATGERVRVGRCMQCGEDIWAAVLSLDVAPMPLHFCNDTCHEAAVADLWSDE